MKAGIPKGLYKTVGNTGHESGPDPEGVEVGIVWEFILKTAQGNRKQTGSFCPNQTNLE